MPLQSGRAGREQSVREHHVELQDSIVVLMTEEALLALGRHHTEEVRIGQRRAHRLCERIVGLSEHPHTAVAPGLLRDPFLRIEHVARFVHVGIPVALRTAASAAVGQDADVSARDHRLGDSRPGDVVTDLQQRGKLTFGSRDAKCRQRA